MSSPASGNSLFGPSPVSGAGAGQASTVTPQKAGGTATKDGCSSKSYNPTPKDSLFMLTIVMLNKDPVNVDWDKVAEELGFKNASVAKVCSSLLSLASFTSPSHLPSCLGTSLCPVWTSFSSLWTGWLFVRSGWLSARTPPPLFQTGWPTLRTGGSSLRTGRPSVRTGRLSPQTVLLPLQNGPPLVQTGHPPIQTPQQLTHSTYANPSAPSPPPSNPSAPPVSPFPIQPPTPNPSTN